MANVLAINANIKQHIEERTKEDAVEAFRTFMTTDEEVRALMLEKAKQLISGLSAFDITYHCKLEEYARPILQGKDAQDLLRGKIMAVLSDGNDSVNHRIIDSIGEYLAGKLTVALS